MANEIQKIAKRAKQLRKQKPNAHRKWTGFIKEAAAEFRNKKAKPKKRVSAVLIREKTDKPRTKPKKVYVVNRRKNGTIKTYKRVGNTGSSSMVPLLLGAAGVGLLFLLFKNRNTTPANYPPVNYAYTGNQTRDTQAQKIIAWATAGGLAIEAITKLIQSLNQSSDSQIQQYSDNIDVGAPVPDYLYV